MHLKAKKTYGQDGIITMRIKSKAISTAQIKKGLAPASVMHFRMDESSGDPTDECEGATFDGVTLGLTYAEDRI